MSNKKKNPHSLAFKLLAKQDADDPQLKLRFSKTWPAFLILVIFISLSFLVWDLSDKQVNADRQLEFDKATTSVMARFELQQRTNMTIITSMTNLYDYLVQVVRDYFQLYSTVPTSTYESILSIMYAQKVSQRELPTFIYDTQSQGVYDYEVKPKGKRDFYLPVTNIVPYEYNAAMSGFDLATHENMIDEIKKVQEKDTIVATSIFTLREPDTLGFCIMAPVFKLDEWVHVPRPNHSPERFKGIVVLEIISNKFFEGAIGDGLASDSSVIFQCYESDASDAKLLWESKNSPLLKQDYSPLTRTEKLIIADRYFSIKFSTIPSFGGGFQQILPIIAFVVSLILSIVMFLFLFSVITSKTRAIEKAERITRGQRRIVDTSQDIIATLDITGVWLDMNPASYTLFELEPHTMVGQKIDSLFANKDQLKEFYALHDKQLEEFTERLDIEMQTPTGEYKWINWSFTISNEEQKIYCIGRDVTLEKAAEQQNKMRTKQIQLSERFTRESSELKSYSMANLSHQIRNSLTGILGSLNILKHKAYDSDEEYDSFVTDSIQSSEKLLNFVSSDQMEIATEQEIYKQLAMVNISRSINEVELLLSAELPKKKFSISMSKEISEATVLAENEIFNEAIREIFKALSADVDKVDIEMTATENPYDNITEITMITKNNPLLAEIIDIYKKYRNDLVNAIELDQKDILLHLAVASSNIRIMRGSFTVESLGGNDENIIQIALNNKP